MKGDILITNDNHRQAARGAVDIMLDRIKAADNKVVITVAGESGSGKSEVAACIAELLEPHGLKCFIFQQDDYFVRPPKSNAEARRKDVGLVGMHEVRLDELDRELKMALDGEKRIEKPLVIFDQDRISSEEVDVGECRVLIAEGTYTTALENAHIRIFIDRNRLDTAESRKERSREAQDEFLEKILKIEHEIIAPQKEKADIIISKSWEARERGAA